MSKTSKVLFILRGGDSEQINNGTLAWWWLLQRCEVLGLEGCIGARGRRALPCTVAWIM